MPLGTLDRNPPPFFRQGPSALSRLLFFSALSLFLMVADVRFHITQPLRGLVDTALYPLQWVVLQPVRAAQNAGEYFESLHAAQQIEQDARRSLAQQSQRANQVEQLLQENARLRELLALSERFKAEGQAAEVLYDAPDPYTRRIVIDRGQLKGVALGSPVIDEAGVLGQVTRVDPLLSEVTLVVDRDFAIPVLNTRTGARSVAYGDPLAGGGGLELRYMPANADVQAGDLLSTSGVDGVYPPGLPVARVDKVERRADSAFARIHCLPLGLVAASRHVMVLNPLGGQVPPRPQPEPMASGRKGGRK
ncbi:rod shape-determining protein MreC [Curvibacter sp. RS43]|uniref:Cell shape-determining protein MreC n=1 Tax=Curvibacter microcysteis TaxID=3026419 RepID=A0ABT5MB33_9BURK|nr:MULTISPECIES: rod shape-determining protein MreC [unclassified Curvibacter]MDD0811244.1 rod shape-determining protein MreC [Curvibacter sp. RS43]MDD0813785.1 rod shape-determining protein MreC [Curvibacter sp. HBC28]